MNTFRTPCIPIADFTVEAWAEHCSKWASQDLTNWERELNLELPDTKARVSVNQTAHNPAPALVACLTGDELLELQDWLPAIAEVLRQLPTDSPFRPCDRLNVIDSRQNPSPDWLGYVKWRGVTVTHTGKEPKYFQDIQDKQGFPCEVAGFAVVHLTNKGTELVVDGDGRWDRLASLLAPAAERGEFTLATGCAEHGPRGRASP